MQEECPAQNRLVERAIRTSSVREHVPGDPQMCHLTHGGVGAGTRATVIGDRAAGGGSRAARGYLSPQVVLENDVWPVTFSVQSSQTLALAYETFT